jgi:hypothetical protein
LSAGTNLITPAGPLHPRRADELPGWYPALARFRELRGDEFTSDQDIRRQTDLAEAA